MLLHVKVRASCFLPGETSLVILSHSTNERLDEKIIQSRYDGDTRLPDFIFECNLCRVTKISYSPIFGK